MSRKKKLSRVVAAVMASVCLLSTAAQAATVSLTKNSVQPEVSTEALSRADALAWVQQKITYYANLLVSELEASTIDPNQIMSDYGCMLVYLNWAAANALNVDNVGYTVFEGLGEVNIANGKNMVDLATSLRNTIRDKGILSSSFNATTLRPNQSIILSLNLPSGSTVFATPGSLHGTATYSILLADIIQYYVDASLLMMVGNEKDATALKGITDYATLGAVFGEEDNASAAALSCIGTLREKLLPYVKVYQNIYAAFVIANSKALKPESLVDDAGKEHPGAPVVNTSMISPAKVFSMSTLSSEICKAFTETTADNSVNTTTEEAGALKTDNGALPLISNMSIINGVVEMPAEGEPELTAIGYRILAAGISYEPLVSKAGNDFYLDVILDALRSPAQQETVNNILLKALSLKKVLYVVSQQPGAWYQRDRSQTLNATEFRVAHLSDILSPGTGDGGGLNLFVLHSGLMSPTQMDSSTVEYYLNGVSEESTELNVVTTKDTTISVAGNTMQGSADRVTKPVAATVGKLHQSQTGEVLGVAGLTSMIMNNVVCDLKGNKYVETAATQTLFMNGLGDIVTVDGTIVLPAIANPMLFNYDANMQIGGRTSSSTDMDLNSSVKSYYPYNAAFTNHYPAVTRNMDNVLCVGGNTSAGKYALAQDAEIWSIKTFTSKGIAPVKASLFANVPNGATLRVGGDEDVVGNAFEFKYGSVDIGWWHLNRNRTFMTKSGATDPARGVGVIPIPTDLSVSSQATRDDYVEVVSALITSCLRYISTKDSSTGNPVNSGVFDVERYLTDCAGEGLLGSQRAEVVARNFAVSYDNIVDDTSNRFEKFMAQIANKLLDTFGNTDGVLAIKGPYENGFFTRVVHFIQQFYPFFAILLLIVMARSFIKGRATFAYVAIVVVVTVASLNVYAYVLPDLLSNSYNVVVNDVVEKTSWATMMHASENYAKTYGDAGRRDPTTGNVRPYTSTITLYRLTDYERDTLAGQLGVEAEDIEAGTRYDMDADAGIFVQGNMVKQSVDRLFANNSMRGLYASQWEAEGLVDGVGTLIPDALNSNPYTIQLEDPYISLEAYYTPYCHIERSFLENLNQFANIFNVPREQRIYADDLRKDAFIYGAFISSGIFVAPGNDSVLKQNISYNTAVQEILSTADILAIAHEYFDPQEDWLNVGSIFRNPTTSLKNSLWGKMLQKQGYYGSDWEITADGEKKFSQLVAYVNNQTKLWVINNQEDLLCCSDENAIKLTALYATTAFNHKVSQISQWLYPNYIDASPFTLKDVLYGTFTSVLDRSYAADGDVVNTMTINLGVVGLLILILIILFSVAFIFVLTYMIPVLYALLGLMILYRISNLESSAQVVTGYVKVTAVSILSYIVFAFGYRVIDISSYQWYGYLATLLISFICCAVLFGTVAAVLLDPMTLGDTTLRNTFAAMFDRLTKGTIGALTASSLRIKQGKFNNAIFNGAYDGYSRGMSLTRVPLSRGARQMHERYSDSYRAHSPLGQHALGNRARKSARNWRL